MNHIRWLVFGTAAAATALSLAGCKKESVVASNESAESVARKVQESNLRPRPGRWESTVTVEKVDMPGLPPQAKAMMDRQMSAPTRFATCLTPEQAAKPDAGFFRKDASGCAYDHFVMADGKIDAVMSCGQQGHRMKIAISGDYTPEAYSVRASTQGEMQPGATMTIQTAIAAHRVGECNGSENR
jgi:hypothetical protein